MAASYKTEWRLYIHILYGLIVCVVVFTGRNALSIDSSQTEWSEGELSRLQTTALFHGQSLSKRLRNCAEFRNFMIAWTSAASSFGEHRMVPCPSGAASGIPPTRKPQLVFHKPSLPPV